MTDGKDDQLHRSENWIKWQPKGMGGLYAYFTIPEHDENGINFIVQCAEGAVKISFDGNIPFYVFSDEGLRTASYAPVQQQHNDRHYFNKWFLYKIENSDLLKWIGLESCGFIAGRYEKHFCIVTEDDVVDILSSVDPRLEFID